MKKRQRMIEKSHVLEILKATHRAIKNQDVVLLKDLSNQTIHSASIYQDPDSIALAVNIYALSKIFEKKQPRFYKSWNVFIEKLLRGLSNAYNFVEEDKLKNFRKEIVNIRKNLNLFGHLKDYIEDVFLKASINKASRIYEHGISRAETSDLLGISPWELARYASVPAIFDVDLTITKSIKERIKFAEELFK